jgi:hypothetical protein
MPATLASFRGWLRQDLNDPAGSSQRFADADLERAVERAVVEYSQAAPRLRVQQLVTTVGSREVSLAGLAGLWLVDEVEWPVGQYPPAQPAWRLLADKQTLTLLVPAAPNGEPVRVTWGSKHTVDAASSTIEEAHETLVARGAYGFACLAYSTPAADNFKYEDGATAGLVDDTPIPLEWRRRAEAALNEFRTAIGRLAIARTRGMRGRVVWKAER